MSKMIVRLVSKKFIKNFNSTCKLRHLKSFSMMSIVETPEKDISNVDWKSDMRKVYAYSFKLSSTIFSFSRCAMYNRVNRSKNNFSC